jgi:hypothetical protein
LVFYLNKKKASKIAQASILMLEASKTNSKTTLELSLIKLAEANGFIMFFLNFKQIVMVDYNAF